MNSWASFTYKKFSCEKKCTSLYFIIKDNSDTLKVKKASYLNIAHQLYWRCCIFMKKRLNRLHVPTFWTVGHNLIHSSSSRHRFHKYSILITTWPFKPFLVEIHNLIKMLSSAIYKFKNPTKDLKSKHQNHFKRNMTRFSHKKNIHRNFQSI